MKRIIITFITLTFFGCTHSKIQTLADTKFKIPIISQKATKDTLLLFNANSLSNMRSLFFGKYKFTDTLNLSDNYFYRDSAFEKDRYYDYPDEYDSLLSDGFQILTEYNTSVHITQPESKNIANYYYPVYVFNETKDTKLFKAKDTYVFAIQEAIDTSYYDAWRPIEGRGFDFCGNGRFSLKVHPGEFVLFLLPKYKGTEKALMRVRLQVGENLYLSKSFYGMINPSQFDIDKNSWQFERLKTDKINAIQWTFLGARPKGFDN